MSITMLRKNDLVESLLSLLKSFLGINICVEQKTAQWRYIAYDIKSAGIVALCKPVNGRYYVYQMEVTKNNGII